MPMRGVMLVMLAIGRMVLAGLAEGLLVVGWNTGAFCCSLRLRRSSLRLFLILLLVVVRMARVRGAEETTRIGRRRPISIAW